jgi:hypothetical protein
MSMSGQLGRRCTVEPNCSDMSTHLAGALVTREHALEKCKSRCVPGAARPFFIPVVHSPLEVVGYVEAPELSSRGGRARSHRTHCSTRAHLDRETRCEAEEHVTAPKLSSRGGKAQSHGTRGSARAHLDREARSGAEEHVVVPELNLARR